MVKWFNGEIKISIGRFFLENIESVHLIYFWTPHFSADKAIHNFQYLITNNKYSNQVYFIKPSDHQNTGLYQESADRCEGYRDSDIIRLASAISMNPLPQPISIGDFPRPEHDLFSITIVDIILISFLLPFSLLRASYLYNSTGLVCYVYTV